MNYRRNFAPYMMRMDGRNNRYVMPYAVGFLEGALSRLKSFNWKGLLNGANKTLNVMNQAIPLIRESKPMFNNIKSMLSLVKSFGKETNNATSTSNINTTKKEVSKNNSPNFFL